MAVSAISLYADEYIAQALASFDLAGEMYVVWAAQAQGGQRTIFWRTYTGTDFQEIQGNLTATFSNVSAIWREDNNTLLIAHDTDGGPGTNSTIFLSVFNPTTGALISGPSVLASGFRPRLMYRGGVIGDEMLLVYSNRVKKTVYLRETDNGGALWSGERPVISNLIDNSQGHHAIPFDDEHISTLILGQDAKPLTEIVSISHTRPWNQLVKHPTVSDEWFVSEPSQNAGNGFADFLRGSLIVAPGSSLFWSDGVRQGSADSIGSVALISSVGNALSVSNSAVPTPSVAGQDIVALSTALATLHVTDVLSTGPVLASLAASAAYVYAAAYSDTPGSDGALVVYRISSQSASLFTSVTAAHAVGVGVPPSGAAVICFGTNESSVEKLRIYTENGLTPTLQITHLMPARVTAVSVVMSTATTGLIYVSMVDRLNVYILNGLTSPIRLTLDVPIISRGQFYQTAVSPSGNIVAAMGKGGVGVFDPLGRTIAQTPLSGIGVEPWRPGTVYATNAIITPTALNFYAPQRTYFKATTGGTSGVNEPGWAPAGTNVQDNSVIWAEQTDIESVVTSVGIDQTRVRIYAAAVVGGVSGVAGRFYALSAAGLL